MQSIKSLVLAGAVLTAMTCTVAAQPSASESLKVAAGGSCKGWFSTCLSRCTSKKELNCDRAFCSGKLATCQQTACWTEGPSYGNVSHCGLAK
jgi:hypothetical protein